MVETEEEFGRDLQQVVERYLKPLDNPGVPRVVRDNKEIIFTNLKQIAEFHNTYVYIINKKKTRTQSIVNSLRQQYKQFHSKQHSPEKNVLITNSLYLKKKNFI